MKMSDRTRQKMTLACAIAASTPEACDCPCASCVSVALGYRVPYAYWEALANDLDCCFLAAIDAAEAECFLRDGWDPNL